MLFEAREICKSFGSEEIIRDFSIEVDEGEFVAIVSKRGRGMTTLIQILCGMLKPSSGEIYFNDRPVTKMGMNKLRRKDIAYIPTEPILVPDMTVYDNLLIAMAHKRGSDKMKKKIAKDILKTLGLKGKGRFYPRELNVYEKQLVCVGRAIIKEPEIIFCDEPTDVLEGYAAEQFMEILEILNGAGYTIVMTTHSKRIAGRAHRTVPIPELDKAYDDELEEEESAYEKDEEAAEEYSGEEEDLEDDIEDEDYDAADEEKPDSDEDYDLPAEDEADDAVNEEEEDAAEEAGEAEEEADYSDEELSEEEAFDEAIARAAYAALETPDSPSDEDDHARHSRISEKEIYDEEPEEDLDIEEDEYDGYSNMTASADYDPDEEFESDAEFAPKNDDDDIWNELKTRKSRKNARAANRIADDEIIPELEMLKKKK